MDDKELYDVLWLNVTGIDGETFTCDGLDFRHHCGAPARWEAFVGDEVTDREVMVYLCTACAAATVDVPDVRPWQFRMLSTPSVQRAFELREITRDGNLLHAWRRIGREELARADELIRRLVVLSAEVFLATCGIHFSNNENVQADAASAMF